MAHTYWKNHPLPTQNNGPEKMCVISLTTTIYCYCNKIQLVTILLTVQSFLRRIWPYPPGEIFGTHCSSRCSCLPCARTDRPSRRFPRGWIARTRAQNRGRPPSFWRRLCSLQPWPSRPVTGRWAAGRLRSDTRTQLHKRGRLLLRWVCKKQGGGQ